MMLNVITERVTSNLKKAACPAERVVLGLLKKQPKK